MQLCPKYLTKVASDFMSIQKCHTMENYFLEPNTNTNEIGLFLH